MLIEAGLFTVLYSILAITSAFAIPPRLPAAIKGLWLQSILIFFRNSRGSCSSRIFLSAMNGKLWITKYHMIHNHPPLPENIKIEPSVRRLQVQEQGNDEPIISEGNAKFNDNFFRCPSRAG